MMWHKQVGTKCAGLQEGLYWATGSLLSDLLSPQGADNNCGNLSAVKVRCWKLHNLIRCNYLTQCLSHCDSK